MSKKLTRDASWVEEEEETRAMWSTPILSIESCAKVNGTYAMKMQCYVINLLKVIQVIAHTLNQ